MPSFGLAYSNEIGGTVLQVSFTRVLVMFPPNTGKRALPQRHPWTERWRSP